MDKSIQLIANYDDWVAIKKLKIEEKTDPRTVMEFLASLTISVDKKVEQNLGKLVDLKKLDAMLAELPAGKSEAEIAEILKAASSGKVNGVINEITAVESLQKNEQKELAGFCKVYALKKALGKAGLSVDYSSVEIPGMKRVMKTKV
ncbi:MAG: DUF2666 family protein [Candidatus Diapherotrites archaeon]|nr:DUF2666 family protein [Candidatus Diapherotrites archaeon]